MECARKSLRIVISPLIRCGVALLTVRWCSVVSCVKLALLYRCETALFTIVCVAGSGVWMSVGSDSGVSLC